MSWKIVFSETKHTLPIELLIGPYYLDWGRLKVVTTSSLLKGCEQLRGYECKFTPKDKKDKFLIQSRVPTISCTTNPQTELAIYIHGVRVFKGMFEYLDILSKKTIFP